MPAYGTTKNGGNEADDRKRDEREICLAQRSPDRAPMNVAEGNVERSGADQDAEKEL